MFNKFARLMILVLCGMMFSGSLSSQTAKDTPPTRYPYLFSNFVWWSDTELRAALRRHLPSLGDDLSTRFADEVKVRDVLLGLLREKGIHASIMIDNPPLNNLSAQRAPGAPPPSIIFSIVDPPRILIENLALENPPDESTGLFNETARNIKGKPYEANSLWIYESRINEILQRLGYLSTSVSFQTGQPKQKGDDYLIPLTAVFGSGPQYHIASMTIDGGPLLQGKDLSSYVSVKSGDIANSRAFSRLINSMRSLYWQAGYPDAEFNANPTLDSSHALVSYRIEVVSGPLYHLRNLKLVNLDATQEKQVRDTLGIKSGDDYNALAVTQLSQKLGQTESDLKGLGFSYEAKEDKSTHVVDLTLNFFKH